MVDGNTARTCRMIFAVTVYSRLATHTVGQLSVSIETQHKLPWYQTPRLTLAERDVKFTGVSKRLFFAVYNPKQKMRVQILSLRKCAKGSGNDVGVGTAGGSGGPPPRSVSPAEGRALPPPLSGFLLWSFRGIKSLLGTLPGLLDCAKH